MSLSSFNQNLIKFLNELNITFPDYPIDLEYYNEKISQQEDVFLLQLFEELNPWVEDISELNQTIFQDEDDHFVLLDKISEYCSSIILLNVLIASESKRPFSILFCLACFKI